MVKYFVTILLIIPCILFAQKNTKITYASTNSTNGFIQIFVMDINGSNKKQIATVDADCFHPRWSPDGSKIVFHTGDERIYLVDSVDSDKPTEPIFVFGGTNPLFSKDGYEIFFNSEKDGFLTIYSIGLEETDAQIVAAEGYSNQQVISKDGTKMVYSGFYNGTKSIMYIDLEDTTEIGAQKISSNDNANMEPDISSQGDMIVFASFNNQLHGTIYIIKGGTETALTKNFSSCNQPKFSPDDKKIGFVVINESSVKLYTMNIDGSNKQESKIKGGNVGTFRWVDNQNIIYDAENGVEYRIGIVNVNTGKCDVIADGKINLHPDVFIPEE